MIERIKNLLPNDRLKVFIEETFFEDANEVITLLYQPLIKITGTIVYQLLWREAKIQKPQTSISHHQLMNMLNMTLDEFYDARKRLEAIGLLKSFKEEGTYTTFYYILRRPLSAEMFFADPMLSTLLEHELGRDSFNRLKKNLHRQHTLPTNVKQVTKSFEEVFTTVKPNSVHNSVVDQTNSNSFETILPLEWLHKMLKQQNIESENILTKPNIEFIEKLSKIYDVDLLNLEKAILWAVDEEHQFDRNEFHDMCKDIYYKKHGSIPPRLYTKDEIVDEQSKNNFVQGEQQRELTKQEKLIQHYEKITHRELLEDLSSSRKASIKEIDMLTNIMEEHGLTQPVMNVLVDYVLRRSGNKLNRNYIETIAAHWSREGIKTAKEAMEIAKREHQLYQKWEEKKSRKKQPVRKEVLPKWYIEQKEKEKNANQQNKAKEDLDKIQREVEEYFKQYSKKNS